jgi:hypothetical protein
MLSLRWRNFGKGEGMSRTLPLATVERALKLIRNKRHWTKFAVTRRQNGVRCKPADDRASRYCAFGAIVKAADDIAGCADRSLVEAAERMVLTANGMPHSARLAHFNDRHGHAAVVKAFEQTLKRT